MGDMLAVLSVVYTQVLCVGDEVEPDIVIGELLEGVIELLERDFVVQGHSEYEINELMYLIASVSLATLTPALRWRI